MAKTGRVIEYFAFLRAINVAGHASVKMSELQQTFVSAGCKGVNTYIQSGNVIFESPEENTPAVLRRIQTKVRTLVGDQSAVLFPNSS